MAHMTLSIHTELKMKSGILLLKMRSAIFLPLEIILQAVILGKLVFKFLSNISSIKLTGLLWLLPSLIEPSSLSSTPQLYHYSF